MSGLCGYLNTVRDDMLDTPRLLAAMAKPMAEFDASPIQTLSAGSCGIAGAARADSLSLHKKDSLLTAVWGRPMLAGSTGRVAERLAELWIAQGPQACAKLSGAFALCILDSASGQALLAVDRSGTHTMSYQNLPRGLLFGSSVAALQAHPQASTELDQQAIYDYLYFHMIPAPRTIYRDQQRLLPGEYLLYRRGQLERASYWTMQFDEHHAQPFGVLKQEFLATLSTSVQHAAGTAKVGAFLSGGTDSSTLAGMLAKLGGPAPPTYSIGFDVPGYDEMAYARIASRHFKTDHHEMYVSADDVVKAIPRIAAASDQPFGNSSVVPTYYCASMARADGITRLLGGDGGDELFGGNERYARQAVFSRYVQVPPLVRQTLLEPLLFGVAAKVDVALLRKARSYVEQARVPMPARLETYNLLQRYGPAAVLDASFLAGIDAGATMAQLHSCYWSSRGLSQINRMQTLDLRYTLADNDLRKVSMACGLAGVEVAFPFLHDEMLEFSARLPPQAKLNGTQLRYFFKLALRDHLPQAILRKKKHGFGLPFGLWLQGHAGLRSLAFDSLSDLKKRHIVRADFIDMLMHTMVKQHPAYHGTMVWVLMMLEQWLRQQVRRQPAGLPAGAIEIAADLAPRG